MYNNLFGIDLSEIGVSGVVVTAIICYCGFMGVIGIILYLLKAIGIYNMSKTAGINNPWIAFVPVINSFTFGTLAEKYNKRDGTKSAKFGITLLILQIVSFVISVLVMIFSFKSLFKIIEFADKAIKNNTDMTIDMFSSLIPVIVLSFIMFAVLLAFAIIRYIALWRIFSSFDYQNATLFTVLSVFFSFLEPIFLFILRSKPATFDYSERMGVYSQY